MLGLKLLPEQKKTIKGISEVTGFNKNSIAQNFVEMGMAYHLMMRKSSEEELVEFYREQQKLVQDNNSHTRIGQVLERFYDLGRESDSKKK